MADASGLLHGLVLEDGRRWGEAAERWQRKDARALLSSDVRRHYWLRARGRSKTTDAAGCAVALLLAEAPGGSRSYVYAADAEQAAIVVDAVDGFVRRTDGLAGALEVGASRVTARRSGASLQVVASDGASAFGTRPWLTVADELGAWPRTANHRRLWSAITSAVPKVAGGRLLVCSTAGSPAGLGHKVWQEAAGSSHWRTSVSAGPSPWWSAGEVEAVRGSLTPAEWRRLVECEWAEGDDALTSPEDVVACVSHPGLLEPVAGVRYVLGMDIGLKKDATAVAVVHRDGSRVMVDRVLRWQGTRRRPVDLDDVEAAVRELSRRYNGAPLVYDPYQAAQLSERLRKAGVRAVEFTFSQAGVNRLARSLYGLIRDRAIGLPDDAALLEELGGVRLVETGPGLVKLVNPPGTHDDMAFAVALAAAHVLERHHEPAVVEVPSGLVSDAQRRLPTTALGATRRNEPRQLQAARAGVRRPTGSRAGLPVGVSDRLAALKARR
jgi:phage terminase large subunit-like protein